MEHREQQEDPTSGQSAEPAMVAQIRVAHFAECVLCKAHPAGQLSTQGTAIGNDGLFSALVWRRGTLGSAITSPRWGVLAHIRGVHRLLTLMWPCTSSDGMERYVCTKP